MVCGYPGPTVDSKSGVRGSKFASLISSSGVHGPGGGRQGVGGSNGEANSVRLVLGCPGARCGGMEYPHKQTAAILFFGGDAYAIPTVFLDLRVCCFYLKHYHCFMCGAALFLGQAHPHQPRACLFVSVVFKAICFKMLCHGIERQRLNSS